MDHAPPKYRHLFLVLATLLFLTMITVVVSRYNFGIFNVWAALLLAVLKSSLVLFYFMHLRHGSSLIQRGFLTTILVLSIMIGFVFLDTAFRGGLHVR